MGERSAQRQPDDRFLVAKVLSSSVLITIALFVFVYTFDSTSPEFSATVSGYGGLVPRAGAAAAPPSFHVAYTFDAASPEFSATVSGYGGLVPSTGAAAAPPSFRVALRVKNSDLLWRHCFEARSAVVEYEGVPLASADLDRFCVPPRSVIEVPVLAAGEGLGMPDQLYESLQSRVERQERVPLEVRLNLEETGTAQLLKSMLLRCPAMLDGRPDLPSRCLLFFFVKPGDGE